MPLIFLLVLDVISQWILCVMNIYPLQTFYLSLHKPLPQHPPFLSSESSPVGTVYLHIYVGPSTAAWGTHQQPYPQWKVNSSPNNHQLPITPHTGLRAQGPSPMHAGILTGLILCWGPLLLWVQVCNILVMSRERTNKTQEYKQNNKKFHSCWGCCGMEFFYIQLNTDRSLAWDEEQTSQKASRKSCHPIEKAVVVVKIPPVHTSRTGDGWQVFVKRDSPQKRFCWEETRSLHSY